MPLTIGVASCPSCGAKVGTLFSEDSTPVVSSKPKDRSKIGERSDYYHSVEKAQERANNSLILALSSFFCPGIGFIMGVAAIVLGLMATKTLRTLKVEEGRGSAVAGLVIGVLGLIVQGGYLVYFMRSGKLPFL